MSTYGRDFENKRGAKRGSFAPKVTMPPDIKFDGQSMYATAFDKKQIPAKHVRERQQAIESLPFQGTSTSRADFPPHAISKRAGFGPKAQYAPMADDRQFDTEQRAQFYKKAGGGATRCPAAALVNKQTQRKGGHSYFTQKISEGGAAEWQACQRAQKLPNSLTGYAIGGTHKGNIVEHEHRQPQIEGMQH